MALKRIALCAFGLRCLRRGAFLALAMLLPVLAAPDEPPRPQKHGTGVARKAAKPVKRTPVPAGVCDCNPTCPPEAVFLPGLSTLPPAQMTPGQTADVSLSFANCSAVTTWQAASGYFLKSASAAQDLTDWGFASVPLPNNPCAIGPCGPVVPPLSLVTLDFTVTAPSVPAQYLFSWGIRHEAGMTQQFVGPVSPAQTVSVVKAPDQFVSICPLACVRRPGKPCLSGPDWIADLSGNNPATAALQGCIDRTPSGGTLELPFGIYLLDGAITINKPMTLRTAGTTGSPAGCLSPSPGVAPCAVLQATGTLLTPSGFLVLDHTQNVTLEHLILDGNKAGRATSPAATNCKNDLNTYGFNGFSNCSGCRLDRIASLNALCGSGFNWNGDGVTVTGSVFRNNGIHDLTNGRGLWSDGLTVGDSDGSHIDGNYFVDNSDVDLIVGGGGFSTLPGTVQNNVILHALAGQEAFAGLMLFNWIQPAPTLSDSARPAARLLSKFHPPAAVSAACLPFCGNFTNTVVSGNSIDCGAHRCDFGVEIGPQAWAANNTYPNIFGGVVTGNTVMNAKQTINVDGAGTTANPITIYGNVTSGWSTPFATFQFCNRTYLTSAFNVSNRGSNPSPNFNVINFNGPPPSFTTINNFCP